jgi:lysozyme family protein
MTADAFPRAVALVLRHEGGYVNDPADPGGETNWGISKKAHPTLSIKDLTRDQAVELYFRDYWLPARCDRLPPAIGIAVFDAAVNQGRYPAILMLQEALGVQADGILGQRTQHAAEEADGRVLVDDYLARRAQRYAYLPTFSRFGLGWMRRLFSTHATCLQVLEEEHA